MFSTIVKAVCMMRYLHYIRIMWACGIRRHRRQQKKIYIGNEQVDDIKIGDDSIDAAYLGDNLVYLIVDSKAMISKFLKGGRFMMNRKKFVIEAKKRIGKSGEDLFKEISDPHGLVPDAGILSWFMTLPKSRKCRKTSAVQASWTQRSQKPGKTETSRPQKSET